MMSSLYISATGMKSLSEGMNVVSNNLANQNTVGFQRSMILYQDMPSATLPTVFANSASGSYMGLGQAGKGVDVGSVRTIFDTGGYENATESTDMAILGGGFFPVAKGDETLYTKAGNFRFNKEGYLVDPTGYNLLGNPVVDGVTSNVREPIKLDLNNPEQNRNIMPPKGTSSAVFQVNLGSTANKASDPTDPYFSTAKMWNGTTNPPLTNFSYNFEAGLKIYDSEGNQHQATAYFDYVGEENGRKVYEYVLSIPPTEDGREGFAGTEAAGFLMAGTMIFDNSGKMLDMTGFAPSDPANFSDLSTWLPTGFDAQGNPAVDVSFIPKGSSQPTPSQSLGVNFGINLDGKWENSFSSAAAVGTDSTWVGEATARKLPPRPSTAYTGNSTINATQNGYPTGYLSNVNITADGYLVGKYSNGQSEELYRIPLAHFTSQDNLRREGGNHFSATPEAGVTEFGFPGTENFGDLSGYTLELSNVDMTREFVDMITTQRGFQMNSKVLTTSDQMIQKALELKR